jgi:hypothetical protein
MLMLGLALLAVCIANFGSGFVYGDLQVSWQVDPAMLSGLRRLCPCERPYGNYCFIVWFRKGAQSAAFRGDDDGGKQANRRQRAQGCREETHPDQDEARGVTAWAKRSKASGEFMAVKKPAKKMKAAKKFKGVRWEK